MSWVVGTITMAAVVLASATSWGEPKMISKEQLFALLGQAHDQYQTHYREALTTYRSRLANGAAEVKAKIGNEPAPYSFWTFDLASGSTNPPDVSELFVEPLRVDEVTAQVTPRLRVKLRPLAWNAVRVSSSMLPVKWPEYEKWGLKWLDTKDERTKAGQDLAGIIHRVYQPLRMAQTKEGVIAICVDFGSAPVDALKELLQLAEAAGVRELTLDSPSSLPPPGVMRVPSR